MADVRSAGKKPQMYKDPVTGKTKVRMVPSKLDVKTEKTLTPAEKSGRERIAKKMDLKDFEKRYGKDDAMAVKMATATKIAKKKYESDSETTGMDEKRESTQAYGDTMRKKQMDRQTSMMKPGEMDKLVSLRKMLDKEKKPTTETKAAPKGYHFTSTGQLKKGDADVDGPGGKKLRADPLDKQRSKIPPLPEEVEENFNWKVSHAGKDVHVKAPHAGAAVKKAQKGFGNMDLTKAKITNLGKVGTPANEAVDPSDTGGAEEVSMAMKQIKAMHHFLDGIEERVAKAGDMEEWFQNKLTKANDYLKSLYSYGKGSEKDDEEEMDEEMRKYTPPTQAEIDADRKKDQRGKSRPSLSARSLNKKLYGKAMGSSKIPEATDKPPFEGPYKRKDEPTKDQYGNVVKPKNLAKFLAKKAMKSANESKLDEISPELKKRYADLAKSDIEFTKKDLKITKDMDIPDVRQKMKRKLQTRRVGVARATEPPVSTKVFDSTQKEAVTYYGNPNRDDDARNAARRRRLAKQDNIMKKRAQDNEKARQALKDPSHNPAWANSKSKVEAVSADRLKFATSGSKTVQDYMKNKADQRAAMNKANDPNAAKKGYSLTAVPPERAYMKARKKGMSTGQARDAMAALAARKKNMSGRLPEETQLDEMKANAAYTKAAKDIKAYAVKNGGIDKNDMMNFAADLELMGRAPNILQAGRILDRINKRFKNYDTDVRELLSTYLKKHGLME